MARRTKPVGGMSVFQESGGGRDPRPVVGIVGGRGRMGSWFAELMERQGLTVLRSDLRTDLSPAAMTAKCDVVVISVPIAETLKVIREIGPLVAEHGLLMDLTSVKKAPLETMLACSTAQVVGLHPLLGPETGFNSGGRVVVCRGRGESGLAWITGMLRESSLEVVYLEAEEHDQMMGLIQGAHHFSTLALALLIGRSGFSVSDLSQCSTETFKERLDRIRSMMGQRADLFGSLLMDNPAAGEYSRRYVETAQELFQMIGKGNRGAFKEVFGSLRGVFAPRESGNG